MTDDRRRGAGRGTGTSRDAFRRRVRGDEARRSDEAPQKVGELLEGVLRDAGVVDDLQRQSALEEWAERVGPKIAQVTNPRSVGDGTLIVEVRSSPWLMELNMMKSEILDRVNADREVPIEKLVFVLSPG